MLSLVYVTLNIIDLTIIYSIFMYFQFLAAPLSTAAGYLGYVIRMSIPYVFMYFLVCIFLNIHSRDRFTIKFLKYSIDFNVVKSTVFFIYLREYSYFFIILVNLILLFVVYYAFIYNKYFYLIFVFLFYLLI